MNDVVLAMLLNRLRGQRAVRGELRMARSRSDMGLSTLPEAVAVPGNGAGRFPSPRPRPRYFVWFTPALALLLGGYLFFNKSFAYLHMPGTPVFVGEIVLGIGIVEVLQRPLALAPPAGSRPSSRCCWCSWGSAPSGWPPTCPCTGSTPSATRRSGTTASSPSWSRPPPYASRPSSRACCAGTGSVLPWYFMWAPIAVALTGVDAPRLRSTSPAPAPRSTPSATPTSPSTSGSASRSSGSASTGWWAPDRSEAGTASCRSSGWSRCWSSARRAAAGSWPRWRRWRSCSRTSVRPAAADRLLGHRRLAGRARPRPGARPADAGGAP